jgi:cytochrome b6-f complex iron-sulfur subunit
VERRVLFGGGAAAVLAGALGALVSGVRFLFPGVLYEPPSRFSVGPARNFPAGAATFIPAHRVIVFSTAEGFYCVSAVCTHLGCNVRQGQRNELACPCHGSVFDTDGAVRSGPAPRPLDCYAVSLSRRAELIVDRTRRVSPKLRFRL